jgi:hypothetical protein
VFHAFFDAADERRDLVAAEVADDVDAGEHPYLAWTDVGDEELPNRSDCGVPEEEGLYSVPVRRWNRLPPEKVVVAFDEANEGSPAKSGQGEVSCGLRGLAFWEHAERV